MLFILGSSTFLNNVALWMPKALNNFYMKYGAQTRLSRLPGDILLPQAVRTELTKYIGYINYFIPHDIWIGFLNAVFAYIIIRVILSIVAEIWFG